MELKALSGLLQNAVCDGAAKAFAGNSVIPDNVSKSEAYRIYGRSNVDRWITENLIIPAKKSINKKQLYLVAGKSNRTTYLSANERKNR